MKHLLALLALLPLVFAAAGCQSAETADKGGATGTGLSPDSVSTDKPIPAGELKSAVTASPNAWKGKEVAVIGNYISNAPTKDGNTGRLLSVQVNLTDSNGSIAVACVSDKEMPQDYLTERKDRVVKGKIKEVTSFGQVKLEPCECVK